MTEQELNILKEKILITYQFIKEKLGISSELFDAAIVLVKKAYEEKDIRVLKEADKDVNEQIKHIPLSLALQLKQILKEELNIEMDTIDKRNIKAIQKIFKAGKIKNLEEYELLSKRVDEIYANKEKENELLLINSLIANFHRNLK